MNHPFGGKIPEFDGFRPLAPGESLLADDIVIRLKGGHPDSNVYDFGIAFKGRQASWFNQAYWVYRRLNAHGKTRLAPNTNYAKPLPLP